MSGSRPKLAVFKFASCDGCQLTLLDAEEHLLALANLLDIEYFLEASSYRGAGPYTIALVEGSITTADDALRIREVRRNCKYLMTIGACATAGGIQALQNWGDRDEYVRAVYARPEYIRTLSTSTPIAEHVPVDFELRGCPINKEQLIDVLGALLAGRRPRVPVHSVCLDCKRRGNVCTMVAAWHSVPGTHYAKRLRGVCPTYDRGCYGCFGPARQANAASLSDRFLSGGAAPQSLVPLLRNFNGYAPEFRAQSERLAGDSASPWAENREP